MIKARLLGGILLALVASPACAEAIPDFVLDRDYQSCLGDDKDPERAAYCACVREGMREWDLDTYAAVAMQAATPQASVAQSSGKLEMLAKQCIEKALH